MPQCYIFFLFPRSAFFYNLSPTLDLEINGNGITARPAPKCRPLHRDCRVIGWWIGNLINISAFLSHEMFSTPLPRHLYPSKALVISGQFIVIESKVISSFLFSSIYCVQAGVLTIFLFYFNPLPPPPKSQNKTKKKYCRTNCI